MKEKRVASVVSCTLVRTSYKLELAKLAVDPKSCDLCKLQCPCHKLLWEDKLQFLVKPPTSTLFKQSQ